MALIPLLFGIQQLTEGVIWVTFRHDAPLLKQTMTYVYSGFSHVLRPMYVPVSPNRHVSVHPVPSAATKPR